MSNLHPLAAYTAARKRKNHAGVYETPVTAARLARLQLEVGEHVRAIQRERQKRSKA